MNKWIGGFVFRNIKYSVWLFFFYTFVILILGFLIKGLLFRFRGRFVNFMKFYKKVCVYMCAWGGGVGVMCDYNFFGDRF